MSFEGPERRVTSGNGPMLARLDERTKDMDEKLGTLVEQMKVLNGRTRTLEIWKAQWTGVMLALTGVASASAIVVLVSRFL